MPWDDLGAHDDFGWWKRYGISKLACLLFLLELDRRLRAAGLPVKAIGCHPGSSITGIIRHYQWPIPQLAPMGLGEIRGRSGPAKREPHALDPADAARLWALSAGGHRGRSHASGGACNRLTARNLASRVFRATPPHIESRSPSQTPYLVPDSFRSHVVEL